MAPQQNQPPGKFRVSLYIVLGVISTVSLTMNLLAAKDVVLLHNDRRRGTAPVELLSSPLFPASPDGVFSVGHANSGGGIRDVYTERPVPHEHRVEGTSTERREGREISEGRGFTGGVGGERTTVESTPTHVTYSASRVEGPVGGDGVWLLILVPTVKRRTSYLKPVLESLLKQVSFNLRRVACAQTQHEWESQQPAGSE